LGTSNSVLNGTPSICVHMHRADGFIHHYTLVSYVHS